MPAAEGNDSSRSRAPNREPLVISESIPVADELAATSDRSTLAQHARERSQPPNESRVVTPSEPPLPTQSPQQGREPAMRSPRDPDAFADSPRPIVRVTIGRIEVRAITPPTPPVDAPAPPTPKLS